MDPIIRALILNLPSQHLRTAVALPQAINEIADIGCYSIGDRAGRPGRAHQGN